MKRRGFLLGLLAAPAAPLLPKFAQPVRHEWTVDAMQNAMLAAVDKIVNPPVIVMTGTSVDAAIRQFNAEVSLAIKPEMVMRDMVPLHWRKS